MRQPLIDRIAAILRERYDGFAAERVALRIVECLEPGDCLGEHWEVVPTGPARAHRR